MIRATFTVAALCLCARSSQAQNPTAPPATPAAPETAAKPAQPTPPPRAKRAPVPQVWSGSDLNAFQDRLESIRDMQLDLDVMPPMPPMAALAPMDLDFEPMDMDLHFDLAPMAMDMTGPPDIDFDVAMPDMPPMPAMTPMVPMVP